MDNRPILNFQEISDEITLRSTKAQCTFLYTLINKLGPSLCRAIIRYATQRLDTLNAALPDDNPHKQFYLKLKKERALKYGTKMHRETQEKFELHEKL